MLPHFVPLTGLAVPSCIYASLSVLHLFFFFFFFFFTCPLNLFNQQATNEMKISHSGSSISALRSWALGLYCEIYSVILILYFLKERGAAYAACILFFLTSYS